VRGQSGVHQEHLRIGNDTDTARRGSCKEGRMVLLLLLTLLLLLLLLVLLVALDQPQQ